MTFSKCAIVTLDVQVCVFYPDPLKVLTVKLTATPIFLLRLDQILCNTWVFPYVCKPISDWL